MGVQFAFGEPLLRLQGIRAHAVIGFVLSWLTFWISWIFFSQSQPSTLSENITSTWAGKRLLTKPLRFWVVGVLTAGLVSIKVCTLSVMKTCWNHLLPIGGTFRNISAQRRQKRVHIIVLSDLRSLCREKSLVFFG